MAAIASSSSGFDSCPLAWHVIDEGAFGWVFDGRAEKSSQRECHTDKAEADDQKDENVCEIKIHAPLAD